MNNNLLMSIMLFFSLVHLPLFLLIVLYKIKIFRGKSVAKKLTFDLILLGLIYFFNYSLVPLYLGVYLSAELMYYLFSRYTNFEVLDRILLSSAIGTLFIYGFYYANSADLYQSLSAAWDSSQEQTKGFYQTALKMNAEQGMEFMTAMTAMTATFNEALLYLKEKFLFISFITLFVINYSINYMYRKHSSKWEVSYLGLLVYIIPVLVMKITGNSSFLLENLTLIGQFIYIIYGIKAIYKVISKKVNAKMYTRILSVAAAIVFPKILFLIGAFKSFNIKIKIVRK